MFHNMEHRVENLSKIFVQQYFAASADLECQERSFRAGDHAAPQRRAAVGGEELRPRPRHGLPFDNLGQMEQLVQTESVLCGVRAQYGSRISRIGLERASGLLVGEPKTVTFSAPPFEPAVHFSGPGGDASAATINGPRPPRAPGLGRRTVTYTKTETAGFYKALLDAALAARRKSAISPSTSIRRKAICGPWPVPTWPPGLPL